MEKTIFEQMGGTYAQAGDYNLPSLILSNEESKPIGIWGQRHARYLKQNRKVLYMKAADYQTLVALKDALEQFGKKTNAFSNVTIQFDFNPSSGF